MSRLDLLTRQRDVLESEQKNLAMAKRDLASTEAAYSRQVIYKFSKLRETLYEAETRALDSLKAEFKLRALQVDTVERQILDKIRQINELKVLDSTATVIPDQTVNLDLSALELLAAKIKEISVIKHGPPKKETDHCLRTTPGFQFQSSTAPSVGRGHVDTAPPRPPPTPPPPPPPPPSHAHPLPETTTPTCKPGTGRTSRPTGGFQFTPLLSNGFDFNTATKISKQNESPPPPSKIQKFEPIIPVAAAGRSTSSNTSVKRKTIFATPTDDGCYKNSTPVDNNFKSRGANVRDFLTCCICKKPRCIYSRKALSDEHKKLVSAWKNEGKFDYVCGDQLPPDVCKDELAVEDEIGCLSDVTVHYFSHNLKYPAVCYVCGSSKVSNPASEVMELYTSYNPVCSRCGSKGRFPRTIKRKQQATTAARQDSTAGLGN